MARSRVARSIVVQGLLLLFLLPVVMVGYQNCSPKTFSTATNDNTGGLGNPTNPPPGGGGGGGTPVNPPGPDGFALQDQLIRTSFGESKTWTASWVGPKDNYTYSFDLASNKSFVVHPSAGRIDVIDANAWQLRYTPQFGFRGEFIVSVFARKTDGSTRTATLTIQVGNAVNLLAPALAVRASGCVTCHAEVHSNIITDFGFGGDGSSRNYYFGGLAPDSSYGWNADMAYGDHRTFWLNNVNFSEVGPEKGSWASLNLMQNQEGTAKRVFVPRAPLPARPAQLTGTSTLQGYLQHRLANSSYSSSRTGSVVEKSKIFIGAPTASRLKQVFNWNNEDQARGFKFIPDAGAPALSGISLISGSYFQNSATLVCEGDLLLDRPVRLANLSVQTRSGCRIYSTGSVFIYGPIQYPTGSGDFSKRNLQISSAKSISMGLGQLWRNGVHCEQNDPNSAYWSYYVNRNTDTNGMTTAQRDRHLAAIADSALFRMGYHFSSEGYFFRNDQRSGPQVTSSLFNEMDTSMGRQVDAACEPRGRNVAFERLLLNAPLVQSRYTGGFKGSIIAEVALMSLGVTNNVSRFVFDFDSVFQTAEILPMLREQDFLHVE